MKGGVLTAILQLAGASLAYGRKIVVTGLEGTLNEGEALALIGPNGSGKTTLLRALTGAVRIAEGSITMPAGASIGYVPQHLNLDATFPITASQVVAMGLRAQTGLLGKIRSRHRERVNKALAQVGLASRANERFGDLSGGQQQRILLARALIANPTLLLLDEPFNGLDEPDRKALEEIITRAKADGIGIVVSTHDISLAQKTCDKAVLLAGRQVAYGRLDEVLRDELVDVAYGKRRSC